MSTWYYQAPPELTDEQYIRWQSLLEQRTGISFLQHKSILQKGLSQRMREVGAENYEQYFQRVSAVPEGAVEWAQLVDRIAVKETSFFREPHSYEVLRKYLRGRLDGRFRHPDYTLDIWSVGCSTGEEAYSLAIAASDIIDYLAAKVYLGVFATDISPSALLIARRGIYSARKLERLPLASRRKYFVPLGDTEYEITPALMQRLCFVQGNLLELGDMPKLAMDVIFCQNVLVYFRQQLKHQVINDLVEHLKPGGLLVLGPGEIIGWNHPQMNRTADESVLAYIKTGASN